MDPSFSTATYWNELYRSWASVPLWLHTQKNLKELQMVEARISDDIPDWFDVVHSRIHLLDLSLNNITGKVPKFLEETSFSDFRDIWLSSNNFEAFLYQFPSDIYNLDLSRNHITGPIPLPEDSRKSARLRFLLLNDNHLNGSIAESICQIRNLQVLDLSNNQLSGSLPLCLGNLRDLFVLNLANNILYGQIPTSLGYMEFLESLVLNNKKYSGELPVSLQYSKKMQFLDIGENELEGIIPSWIGKHLLRMRISRLQSNHFYGNISLYICQLSNLQVLNLAQNRLTGSIPRCFNDFSAMGLNISELQEFRYMDWGDVYLGRTKVLVNFMGGRELKFSRNLPYLTSLDLSQNNLVGEIPKELMDLVGLQNLKLSRNHLSGNIPEKIGNLKQLRSLDLSMNQLSGSIPPSLADMNFLSYLNLSSNRLWGPIPTGNQLQTLDNPSIYAGNSGLWGKPLSINCSNDKLSQGNGSTFGNKVDKENVSRWFIVGLGPGYATGFSGVLIILFKKSWRHALFHFVESFCDSPWVRNALKTSKRQRKLH